MALILVHGVSDLGMIVAVVILAATLESFGFGAKNEESGELVPLEDLVLDRRLELRGYRGLHGGLARVRPRLAATIRHRDATLAAANRCLAYSNRPTPVA